MRGESLADVLMPERGENFCDRLGEGSEKGALLVGVVGVDLDLGSFI